MILTRRVSLGNVQLDKVDSRIVITAVEEADGKDNISATAAARGFGQRITSRRRDTLDVTVKFKMMIRKDDMAGRSELLEKVNAWAAPGGWLRVAHRPKRRLMVTLAQAPGAANLWMWTEEYSIVFRAYSVPYWEDDEETVLTGKTIKTGSLNIQVPGNAKTDMRLRVENMSGVLINWLALAVDGNKMEYNNLHLEAGQTLVIDYRETQDLYTLRMRIGSRSVLNLRTADSADEFPVNPGLVGVSWGCDRALRVTASCRGRYL